MTEGGKRIYFQERKGNKEKIISSRKSSENIEGTSKKSLNKNSRVKSKFGGDPLLRKVFEKHYGQPKKTFSKKRGKENRDEPGPSKQRKLPKQKRTPWTKEEDSKLVKH